MSKLETDAEFRDRIRRVVAEGDWLAIAKARERALDELGRRDDRFRYGSSLQAASLSNEGCTDPIDLMPSSGGNK